MKKTVRFAPSSKLSDPSREQLLSNLSHKAEQHLPEANDQNKSLRSQFIQLIESLSQLPSSSDDRDTVLMVGKAIDEYVSKGAKDKVAFFRQKSASYAHELQANCTHNLNTNILYSLGCSLSGAANLGMMHHYAVAPSLLYSQCLLVLSAAAFLAAGYFVYNAYCFFNQAKLFEATREKMMLCANALANPDSLKRVRGSTGSHTLG